MKTQHKSFMAISFLRKAIAMSFLGISVSTAQADGTEIRYAAAAQGFFL